ncbi:MAG: hypothetical protein RL528_302 [Bacteroidota bacterium]|jgi:hypothetical protein
MKIKLIKQFKSVLTGSALIVALCASAQTTTYEAEDDARLVGNSNQVVNGVSELNQASASGGKVVGGFNNTNSLCVFRGINGGTGGTANLTIRYSNGSGSAKSLTYFYGGGVAPNFIPPGCNQIIFPSTGGWDTYAEITVNVYLEAGTTQFKLQKIDQWTPPYDIVGDGPRIDWFTVSFINWTGTTSSDYGTASNWSHNAVPSATSIINIPAVVAPAVYPTISTPVTIAGATIAASASLTIDATGVLNVIGSNVSSAYDSTVATATNTFFSTGVITNTGTLNNNGTITNNGELRLLSDVAGTGNLVSASSVANVTQQRFLSSNQRGWRLLSNPLANTTFATLASASNLTLGANFTGQYNSAANTWTSTDGTAAMNSNNAYKVFITGQAGEAPSYVSGPTNVTLVNKGTAANVAPAAVTTTATRFYLVANPYTAPVSVARIIRASTGLSRSVTYYNPTRAATNPTIKAGGYDPAKTVTNVVINEGTPDDILIPPMGAIFVQATAAGTINVPKTAIFTGRPSIYNSSYGQGAVGVYNHKTALAKAAAAPVALTIDVASNGVDYDQLQLRFKEAGTAGSNVDFGKLPNTFLDLYSIDNGTNKAVSELELKDQTIALGVTSTLQQSFAIKVAENNIPEGYEAVLVDTYLNKNTVMTSGSTYAFAIDSNPASQGNARFAINLKSAASLTAAESAIDSAIQVYPNPSHGQFNIDTTLEGNSNIEISSLNGQVIHTQQLTAGSTTIQTKSWTAGVYILKATNNGTVATKKLLIQ